MRAFSVGTSLSCIGIPLKPLYLTQPEPRSPVPLKNIPLSLHSWDVDVENLDVENSSTCS